MKLDGRILNKHTGTWVITAVLLSFVSFFMFGLSSVPNAIIIQQGSLNKLNFNIMATATFSVDSQAVMKVNDKPVDDELRVNMNEEITIVSDEQTNAEMTITALGIPLKKVTIDVAEQMHVIPCGMTIGVKINTDGIMVLGTGYVNGADGIAHKPADGILKAGDLILSVNGKDINSKEELAIEVEKTIETANVKIKRGEDIMEEIIHPIESIDNHANKIGVWVRDSTQGIGTITYINPETMKFGALGHGIMDVDTKQLMSVKDGELMSASVRSVKKGKKGSPGELIGDIMKDDTIGHVRINNKYGLYGNIVGSFSGLSTEAVEIATQNDVHEGPAVILSNICGTEVVEYNVNIESVNRMSSDDSKGMIIKIVDESLIEKTNGIVQGMSGSPIMQNGKLIGAVTHVFVQDPSKGYGIFIENMIKQEKGF